MQRSRNIQDPGQSTGACRFSRALAALLVLVAAAPPGSTGSRHISVETVNGTGGPITFSYASGTASGYYRVQVRIPEL